MKSINIMKPFDKFLNIKIQEVKSSPSYQKMVDRFSTLEDKNQSIIKLALFFSLFIIPLILLLIVSSFSSSLKEELMMKENIIKSAKSIIALTSSVKKDSNKALSKYVETDSELKTQISRSLSRSGIDTNKVEITNFSIDELKGEIAHVQADIVFKGFSSENIYDLFDKILITSKIRSEELEVRKNLETNLLDGMITISSFSRMPSDESEEDNE